LFHSPLFFSSSPLLLLPSNIEFAHRARSTLFEPCVQAPRVKFMLALEDLGLVPLLELLKAYNAVSGYRGTGEGGHGEGIDGLLRC